MFLLLLSILMPNLVAPAAMTSHGPSQQIIREESPIRDALIGASIIPDVLDDFTPTFALLISYPSTHTTVSLGRYIAPDAVHPQPIFEFHPLFIPPNQHQDPTIAPMPHPAEKSYSIILTDPDAKSRKHPIWSEMCHWIVGNISSPGLIFHSQQEHGDRDANINNLALPSYTVNPQILKSYLPPSPPLGTDYHRYVFVLLEGDAATAYNVSAPRERKHWGYGGMRRGVRDWAAEYGLKVVGATFFYARAVEKG